MPRAGALGPPAGRRVSLSLSEEVTLRTWVRVLTAGGLLLPQHSAKGRSQGAYARGMDRSNHN